VREEKEKFGNFPSSPAKDDLLLTRDDAQHIAGVADILPDLLDRE
jgi:hypothetical protein